MDGPKPRQKKCADLYNEARKRFSALELIKMTAEFLLLYVWRLFLLKFIHAITSAWKRQSRFSFFRIEYANFSLGVRSHLSQGRAGERKSCFLFARCRGIVAVTEWAISLRFRELLNHSISEDCIQSQWPENLRFFGPKNRPRVPFENDTWINVQIRTFWPHFGPCLQL